MTMTVLITGVAGFIGFHVARRLLDRGEKLVGIDSLSNHYSVALKLARIEALEHAHSAFKFIKVDFTDFDQLTEAVHKEGIERIIHLGAQAGVRHSMAEPLSYIRTNLVGHGNILELCRRLPSARHLVYASTSAVYGGTQRLPFSLDERADRPLTIYGATKRADELMSEAYAHLHRLPQTGLRFFTAYGPWGRPDMAVWLFAEAILAGRPIRLFNAGKMRRDFTFIDDIVTGTVAALDRPPTDDRQPKPGGSVSPHAIYNLGSGRPETLTRLVSLLEGSLGRKARIELLPAQPGETMETHADITAAAEDLGYAPAVDLEEGIGHFARWFLRYSRP
jgi:UDP-glucuronate 4-epimerase